MNALAPLARITVDEITTRLGVSKTTVYDLLERRVIPAMRKGRTWLIPRHAYTQWEKTFGTPAAQEAVKISA